MTPCDHIRPRLDALADGELSPWDQRRVRQHVQICPTCRAEYQAIQALGAQVRAWRDVSAPPALRGRLARAVTQTDPTLEETPMTTTSFTLAPPRPRTVLRWQPLVGAGALAALIALSVVFFPGSPGRPIAAFADVQRAMQAVRTVSWTESQTRDKNGRLILCNTQRIWVRRDPPAVAEWDSESTVSQVPGEQYAGPTRYLSNSHGWVQAHPRDGVYYLHPPEDTARRVAQTIDDLTAARAKSYGTPEWVTLDGRPALRFHQKVPPDATLWPESDVTLWVDSLTLRVVRKRIDQVVHFPTGAEHIVFDATGFHYNTPAPAGVFDLAPPPGARTTEDDGHGNKTIRIGADL